MADITPETAIRRIFESPNPKDAFSNAYDPNIALGVQPYWLPLGEIWGRRNEQVVNNDVIGARACLETLYIEYTEACQ